MNTISGVLMSSAVKHGGVLVPKRIVDAVVGNASRLLSRVHRVNVNVCTAKNRATSMNSLMHAVVMSSAIAYHVGHDSIVSGTGVHPKSIVIKLDDYNRTACRGRCGNNVKDGKLADTHRSIFTGCLTRGCPRDFSGTMPSRLMCDKDCGLASSIRNTPIGTKGLMLSPAHACTPIMGQVLSRVHGSVRNVIRYANKTRAGMLRFINRGYHIVGSGVFPMPPLFGTVTGRDKAS